MEFTNQSGALGKGQTAEQDKPPVEDRVLAFDTLFTTNQIQKLKIVISFLGTQMQKQMAIYIKYMELQYTIAYFQSYPYQPDGCFPKEEPVNFHSLQLALLPYASAQERKQIEQFMGIFRTMETYRQFTQISSMLKGFMPDMGNNMGDMSSFMSNMGTISSLMGNMGDMSSFMNNMGDMSSFMSNMGDMSSFMNNMGDMSSFMSNMGDMGSFMNGTGDTGASMNSTEDISSPVDNSSDMGFSMGGMGNMNFAENNTVHHNTHPNHSIEQEFTGNDGRNADSDSYDNGIFPAAHVNNIIDIGAYRNDTRNSTYDNRRPAYYESEIRASDHDDAARHTYPNADNIAHSNTNSSNNSFNSGGGNFNTGNSSFNTGNSGFNTGNSGFNANNSSFNAGNSSFNTGNSNFNAESNSIHRGYNDSQSQSTKKDDNGADNTGSNQNSNSNNNNNGNMMNLLLSLLTPEQMQMFEMLGGNQIE